jgi:hypothetical protein
MSKFFKCSRKKTSSAMMKLALMKTDTGKEDPKLPLLQMIRLLELLDSQSSSNIHISTLTVQRRLHESGLYGWITAKKPLLKDTNKKKRLAWAKKHKQWTLDLWKSVLWSDESKCFIFVSKPRVFVRCRIGEWMISAFVVPTVSMEEEVWWCGDALLVTLSVIYLDFKANLAT